MSRSCPTSPLIAAVAAAQGVRAGRAVQGVRDGRLAVSTVRSRPCSAPNAAQRALNKRMQRLSVLITIIVGLSIADLLFTLIHLQSLGMVEANPVARAIILTGDAHQLVSFKLASVAVGCGCLYLGRRSRKIEFAAWLCAIGLGVLTVHWFNYNAEFKLIAEDLVQVDVSQHSESWVTLPRN
jgi:hypothetical protein